MRQLCLIAVMILGSLLTSASTPADQAKWQSLFDGKTLDGWVQRGGKATYQVEDGAIVGRSVPNTSNSFLCTKRHYGDFVLELEFKVHPKLNSGIQVRSHSLLEHKKGRVHGYQVEIDPSNRAWSAGIYDESRRGWLYSLEDRPAARAAFKQGEWNHVRVEAIGDSIKTWLNGVPAADLRDAMTLTGFIALQVHGVGERQEPLDVRWRSIRIQDLGVSRWQSLFDGHTLSGWTALPGGEWTIEDGAIQGRSGASEPRHGMLLSDRRFGDFTAKVVYRAKSGNSGFYFRADKVDGAVGVHGFQAEIDARADAGGLYETGGRAWVVQPKAEDVAKYFKPGKWNEMIVSAHGRRVVVHVNGTRTAELRDDPGRLEGHFGLQLHGGQDMDVQFEAVELLMTKQLADESADAAPSDDSPVVAEGAEIRKIAGGFAFTEGPSPSPDGKIYFSDIPNERIHVYDPKTDQITVFREESGRANGLMFGADGSLYACEGGSRKLTRHKGGEWTVLAEQFDGKKLNSPNDLDLDHRGGVYFTDLRYGSREDMEMDVEGVYYLSTDGQLVRVVDDLGRPNGLILSLDKKTLYVVDNSTPSIWAFEVQPDGKLGDRHRFADMDAGRGGGDGMTIDERGNVYCAGQGSVWVWNPQGELLTKITPAEAPANCVFGGPDGRTLYMTARQGFYSIRMNVKRRP